MTHSPRHPELDLLRTIAILLMVTYHAAYDLAFFYHWNLNVLSGPWKFLAHVTATLFLLLVGISFSISWHRTPVYRKYFKRGIGLIGCGMIISLVTFVIDPPTYVRFGILHLIGTGILLLPLTQTLREWNIVLGTIVLTAGFFVQELTVSTSLLIPLGFPPPHFATVDYFPLFPWFGVMLLGTGMGHELYISLQFPTRKLQPERFWKTVTWPGRHALMIYLMHQPIMIALFIISLGKPTL